MSRIMWSKYTHPKFTEEQIAKGQAAFAHSARMSEGWDEAETIGYYAPIVVLDADKHRLSPTTATIIFVREVKRLWRERSR